MSRSQIQLRYSVCLGFFLTTIKLSKIKSYPTAFVVKNIDYATSYLPQLQQWRWLLSLLSNLRNWNNKNSTLDDWLIYRRRFIGTTQHYCICPSVFPDGKCNTGDWFVMATRVLPSRFSKLSLAQLSFSFSFTERHLFTRAFSTRSSCLMPPRELLFPNLTSWTLKWQRLSEGRSVMWSTADISPHTADHWALKHDALLQQ